MKTIFTLLLFLFTISLFAQMQPGTWLLGGGAGAGKTLNIPEDNFNIGFYPQIAYLFSKHLMAGAAFQYSYDKYNNQSDGSTIAISPFIRYYLSKENTRWNWFFQTSYFYQRYQYNDPDFKSVSNYSTLSVGGGFDYFLNSNIALENELQYEMVFVEGQNGNNLILDASLKFFLPPSSQDTSKNIAIEKGARLIGFTARGAWNNFNHFENDYAYLSINPTLGFFITSRLVIGSGLFLGFANQNSIVELQPFTRYYFGKQNIRFQPFATLSANTRFQLADKTSESSFFNLDVNGGIGADFFLTRNVALEGLLQLNGNQVEDETNNRNFLNFNIGFQFFLD